MNAQAFTDYFKKRKNARTTCEEVAGIGDVVKLAKVYTAQGKRLSEVCEVILHQACMATQYSSEELKIFKTGLFALVQFLEQCNEEVKADKNLEIIKQKNR